MKHNVEGILWFYYARGLRVSVKPGVNGPAYRLERDIHSKTGRRYWEVFWCPDGAWQSRKYRVFLGRAYRYVHAARYAEMHAATQPDKYYQDQLKEAEES